MGNGNFCISVKDYTFERNDSLENPIDLENGLNSLFPNGNININNNNFKYNPNNKNNNNNNSYYNNSQSNIPHHYSNNYIIINSLNQIYLTIIPIII